MIEIRNEKEIAVMSEGGRILAEVIFEVLKHVKPGVSGLELNQLAERLIVQKGGEPGFKKVRNYKHALCICVNDVVVHGIPIEDRLKEEDVVTIDCGVYYKGFHTDMAETVIVTRGLFEPEPQSRRPVAGFPPASAPPIESGLRAVGSPSTRTTPRAHTDRFLNTGKRALEEAIKQARAGNRIGHISKTIQEIVEGAGYSVVRTLVGHGVGRNLHEEPEVPGFLAGSIVRFGEITDEGLKSLPKTPLLLEGMTLAIEVIYNMGKSDVVYANSDGWTIKTKDGSLSGVFERTIAVAKEGPLVLTE